MKLVIAIEIDIDIEKFVNILVDSEIINFDANPIEKLSLHYYPRPILAELNGVKL